jgi:hypothetical protein
MFIDRTVGNLEMTGNIPYWKDVSASFWELLYSDTPALRISRGTTLARCARFWIPFLSRIS